jgi:hypothetical protein
MRDEICSHGIPGADRIWFHVADVEARGPWVPPSMNKEAALSRGGANRAGSDPSLRKKSLLRMTREVEAYCLRVERAASSKKYLSG